MDQMLPKYLRTVETGWHDNLPDLFFLLLLFHGSESTRATIRLLLPGKKAETQIRCDRLIAARCSCFGKQDGLCLSDEKCCGGRRTGLGDSEGREREKRGRWRRRAVQNENETAKCWTVWCDLFANRFL